MAISKKKEETYEEELNEDTPHISHISTHENGSDHSHRNFRKKKKYEGQVPEPIDLTRLKQRSIGELMEIAREMKLENTNGLKKQNLILVPTPGQYEQKYLAYYWEEKFSAKVIQQKALSSVSVFEK